MNPDRNKWKRDTVVSLAIRGAGVAAVCQVGVAKNNMAALEELLFTKRTLSVFAERLSQIHLRGEFEEADLSLLLDTIQKLQELAEKCEEVEVAGIDDPIRVEAMYETSKTIFDGMMSLAKKLGEKNDN